MKNGPKIAERVKFWEEQDRINRELIPRVIKNHELLAKHIESHEEGDPLARARIEALEKRIGELELKLVGSLPPWVLYVSIALAFIALGFAFVR